MDKEYLNLFIIIMANFNNAMSMITLAYSDNVAIRNLDMRVRCNDKEEFLQCVDIIGEYNRFNREAVEKVLDVVKEYYSEGFGVVGYSIGRENSPVIYLEILDRSIFGIVKELKTLGIADEVNIKGQNIRVWFD